MVTNGGPGLAVQVGYSIVEGDRTLTGLVGNGFLHAGGEGRARLGTLREGSVTGVYACRDVANNLHVWTFDGGYKRIDRKRILGPERVTIRTALKEMYPSLGLPPPRRDE